MSEGNYSTTLVLTYARRMLKLAIDAEMSGSVLSSISCTIIAIENEIEAGKALLPTDRLEAKTED